MYVYTHTGKRVGVVARRITRETVGEGGGGQRESEALYPILVTAQCIPPSSNYVGGGGGGGVGGGGELDAEGVGEVEQELLTTGSP
jgi:hypothetical protein